MTKRSLTKDGQFIVGEAKTLNYVMGFFFIALFIYGLVDAIQRNFKNIDYQTFVFSIAIVPAVYCFRRAHSGRVYIRINKKGIYHGGKLITDWANFISAFVDQKAKNGFFNIQDNFLLFVEYKRNNKGLRYKIPLTNTQNKAEEEVLEAVIFFWQQYKLSTRLS